jgi:hypothetical protein
MTRTKARATLDDLRAVPDTEVADIIAGELIVNPRLEAPYGGTVTMVGWDLIAFQPPWEATPPRGYWITHEPWLHFGGDVLVPDVAAWARHRMPTMPETSEGFLTPDWLCEVVSPATGRIDRCQKMPRYARHGVPHLWLVDPFARTLEVYRLEEGRWIVASTHGGDDVVHAEPFETIELRLERWWSRDAPVAL